MSYEDKGTWVYLVASAGAYAIYLAIVLGRVLSTPVAEVPYISLLLWTTGASIVVSIAGRILIETARPSDSRRSDERDKEISRFGEHASRWFVVAWRRGGTVHGDGTAGLLLDRQRPLPRIRFVGDRRVSAEPRRLPARPVARRDEQADQDHQLDTRAAVHPRRDDAGAARTAHRSDPADHHRHRARPLLPFPGDGLPDRPGVQGGT